MLLAAKTTVVFAQGGTADTAGQARAAAFSLGSTFTFLLLTIGPFNVLGPFASMTRGRDAASKRQLAFQGIVISVIATLVASTLGASFLQRWGISIGALTLTAGIVLFLVALQTILQQYGPREPRPNAEADLPAPPISALAFSPLAFPTIITPHGVAVLILVVTLAAEGDTTLVLEVLGVAVGVLVLDLLAMLFADRILKTSILRALLGIVGTMLGVLQVALGVQAIASGLRLLGIVGSRVG